MVSFLVRRIALGLLVVFGVLVITFLLTRVVPSDPVSQWVGPRATAEQRAEARIELGLNKPVYVQFAVFLSDLAHLDLGRSLSTHQPVAKQIAECLPATLELVAVAMVFAFLIGVPMGVISAKYKDRWRDHTARVISVCAIAMPTFWLALMLQMVFYRWFGILPLGGQLSRYYQLFDPVHRVTGSVFVDAIVAGRWGALWDYSLHLVLPAVALGAGALANLARITRSAMLEILNEDYILAARSYGLSENVVLWQYGLKNALGPTATVTALIIGFLLVNTFLVEAIFNWPGIGSYIATAVTTLDYPAIIGVTLVSAIAYVILNMAADIVVALDPRVRQ